MKQGKALYDIVAVVAKQKAKQMLEDVKVTLNSLFALAGQQHRTSTPWRSQKKPG
jgi:hypothetical protein